MVTSTRLSLRLDKSVVAELKQKALSEGKSLSQFIIDSKDYFDFEINENIFLRIDYIEPIKSGSEIYRINIYFREAESQRILRPLWYELWVLQECVEDSLNTPSSPSEKDFAEYAFRFILRRYKENNNSLPTEFGAFVLPKRTIKLAKNREELWMWYDEATAKKKV